MSLPQEKKSDRGNLVSDIIGFMIAGLVLAYFLCQFLSLLAVIYIVIKKSDRLDKIVFTTGLGPGKL